ncbi:leucyl aminopeptidase [Thermococcus chitonophagus]|uniref:Leucyl aminopeptidase n=1 Tax=Thermococcus chitonophagus TaxID=54262 RepID=A0A160VTR3_9EURY|nr:leucyl aminopeptidase [Thermococcus chitonophagus]ASJ16458.1 leucyl aminopeptidase [Thermococcus chitonophagus]CUX78547.1 Leucyl aminopeptidase [Thermococcus chitonophagus]
MYEFELGLAAEKLVRDILNVKDGEVVAITADTLSSEDVVNATAREVFKCGGKPLVLWIPTPPGVGKAADPALPQRALIGMLKGVDIWIEFNHNWLLYSTVFDEVLQENKDLRYICLVGMNPEIMVRTIGKVNMVALAEFLEKLGELTSSAREVRITTPAGTDVEFRNKKGRPIIVHSGRVNKGEYEMLPGQISWTPKLKTIYGKIVFDGSLYPPIGLLRDPVTLIIEKGRIVDIQGKREAQEFEKWLESFEDENMYQLAHISYGFNPGAKLTGNIVEDERVWGATEWGVGNIGPRLVPDIPGGVPAASHSDGICLRSSVWLDDTAIMSEGEVVSPQYLVELANKARKLEM